MARRSVLFTPGDRREMLEGAAETDADVLVFDLEDGVAPERTAAARETVVTLLGDDEFAPDAELLVRVNRAGGDAERPDADGERSAATDVAALGAVSGALDGVVLPKVESGRDIRTVASQLRRHGLPRRVIALVETAAGVLAAPEIAAAGATDALAFGAEDLAADLGATRSDEGREVTYARQRVLTAARSHDVDAVDTLWTAFDDVEGLRADARRAVELGFDGKLAIHPDQIGPINDAFTPDEETLSWARRVLEARDAADDAGRGAFAVDGEMIDAPLIAQAERVLQRARAAGLDGSGADLAGSDGVDADAS